MLNTMVFAKYLLETRDIRTLGRDPVGSDTVGDVGQFVTTQCGLHYRQTPEVRPGDHGYWPTSFVEDGKVTDSVIESGDVGLVAVADRPCPVVRVH
ncbi:hypothetical protein BMS3Bbin04_00173 [bacterium BMS3Bbin04]|nr:hypothetical protein BMS3Bbin04_00173 [bacterium BMS3Bbin04]